MHKKWCAVPGDLGMVGPEISADFHPEVRFSRQVMTAHKPVLLVMDYAFGTQAFEAMGEAGIRPTYMITKIILEKILAEPSAL